MVEITVKVYDGVKYDGSNTKVAESVEDMIRTNAVRRFDHYGRIYIPDEIREKALGTQSTEGKDMEIFYKEDGTIIIKPVKE